MTNHRSSVNADERVPGGQPCRHTATRPVTVTHPGAGRLRQLAAVALTAALLSACDERLSDITGPTPNLSPTFSSIQREIFASGTQTSCTNCHNAVGARFAANLDLSGDGAYARLVNTAAQNKAGAVRVIPNDPDNSYLIQKLEGRRGIAGQRMPPNGPPYLTDGQILVIRRWIQLGAERN